MDRNGESTPRISSMADYTTIYVLGSGSAGKTTLINRLLDKSEIPKPTIGLDYTFARRTAHNKDVSLYPVKEVCNIWELGGDAAKFPDLIDTPVITCRGLDKMSIFLVFDLSNPLQLWTTFEASLKYLKSGVTQAFSKHNMGKNKGDITKILDTKLSQRLGNDVQDKRYLDPFPLPIVIIGTKFDLFQNFEPERRKQVCRILRLASHKLGASLNVFSTNDIAHARRVRELFTHYAFGTKFPKEICHDFNKGLQIPHGGDSFEQIWPGSNPSQFTMDYFRHLYESQIGGGKDEEKAKEKKEQIENPLESTQFREPQIDSQRTVLMEELRTLEQSFKNSDMSDLFSVQTS